MLFVELWPIQAIHTRAGQELVNTFCFNIFVNILNLFEKL